MRYQIVTKNGKYWIQEKGWCVRPSFIERNVYESQEAAETALMDYLKEPDLVKEYVVPEKGMNRWDVQAGLFIFVILCTVSFIAGFMKVIFWIAS